MPRPLPVADRPSPCVVLRLETIHRTGGSLRRIGRKLVCSRFGVQFSSGRVPFIRFTLEIIGMCRKL